MKGWRVAAVAATVMGLAAGTPAAAKQPTFISADPYASFRADLTGPDVRANWWIDARLQDGSGDPLVGQIIVFSVAGIDRCVVTTSETGHAKCPVDVDSTGETYAVRFDGDRQYAPSSDEGAFLPTITYQA